MVELPIEAQFSIVYATYSEDLDHDHLKEIILGGNQYRTKPETGRYDASYGLVIKQLPNHQFKSLSSEDSGVKIKGEIRDIKPIIINKFFFPTWPISFDNSYGHPVTLSLIHI